MGKEKILLKLFALSSKIKSYLHEGIEILHEGFWLGIMNKNGLKEIAQIYYSSAQLYRNDEHNLIGFFDWEKIVIDSYFKNCKNVLVGAAGAGREIIALSNHDIIVDAFECNPSLIDECRLLLNKVGVNASIVLTEPDNVPDELGSYDGLIIGWGGYMHIIGADNRIRFLKQCRKHIRPDGPILVSFFIIHGNSLHEGYVLRTARFIRALRRSKEPLELGDSLSYAGFCHKFSKEQIQDEFKKAGYHLVYYSTNIYPHAVGRALEDKAAAEFKGT